MHFSLGSKVYREVVGIQMESDPCRQLFRFIDEFAAVNNDCKFEGSYKEIYPPELELKKENSGVTEGSFLDHVIKIEGNRFSINLFDKRDAFPFSIVRMPSLCSNILSKVFYATNGSEILRIVGVTTIMVIIF